MIDAVSPINDPNKVASLGFTTFAPGREGKMEFLVSGQAQMTFQCSVEAPLLLQHASQPLDVT